MIKSHFYGGLNKHENFSSVSNKVFDSLPLYFTAISQKNIEYIEQNQKGRKDKFNLAAQTFCNSNGGTFSFAARLETVEVNS